MLQLTLGILLRLYSLNHISSENWDIFWEKKFVCTYTQRYNYQTKSMNDT
jgi:hypothetical protein